MYLSNKKRNEKKAQKIQYTKDGTKDTEHISHFILDAADLTYCYNLSSFMCFDLFFQFNVSISHPPHNLCRSLFAMLVWVFFSIYRNIKANIHFDLFSYFLFQSFFLLLYLLFDALLTLGFAILLSIAILQ